MVSTRLKTNSLPAKRATFAELQAAETEEKLKANAIRPKRNAAKATSKQFPGVNKRPPSKKSTAKPATASPDTGSGKQKNTVQDVSTSNDPSCVQRSFRVSAMEGATTFLDLPAELRNEIYGYALINQTKILSRGEQPHALQPTLCLVSRQIRSEVLSIFSAEKVHEIYGSSLAVKFLRTLPQQDLQAVRALRITVDVTRSIKEAQDRIRQLVREFGPRGLRRQAVHFLVRGDKELVWANLAKLKQLADGC